jgi:hypothetical protein
MITLEKSTSHAARNTKNMVYKWLIFYDVLCVSVPLW